MELSAKGIARARCYTAEAVKRLVCNKTNGRYYKKELRTTKGRNHLAFSPERMIFVNTNVLKLLDFSSSIWQKSGLCSLVKRMISIQFSKYIVHQSTHIRARARSQMHKHIHTTPDKHTTYSCHTLTIHTRARARMDSV